MKPGTEKMHWDDTTRALIEADGTYDMYYPGGRHKRGQAADVEAAKAEVNAAHDEFILTQWKNGHYVSKASFLVPLT